MCAILFGVDQDAWLIADEVLDWALAHATGPRAQVAGAP